MKITNVSMEDGKNCAALLNALKIAKFENLSVQDMEALIDARKWLNSLALGMAKDLKESKNPPAPIAPPPNPGIKVKKITPPASGSKGKK